MAYQFVPMVHAICLLPDDGGDEAPVFGYANGHDRYGLWYAVSLVNWLLWAVHHSIGIFTRPGV